METGIGPNQHWWQSEPVVAWALLLFFPLGLWMMRRYTDWRPAWVGMLVPLGGVVTASLIGLQVLGQTNTFLNVQTLTTPSTHGAPDCTWSTRTLAPTTTAASGLASPTPGSRPAVAQSTTTLRVVALGDFPAPLLERLRAYFRDRHGITLVIVPPLPLTDDLVDGKRDQLVDERLLQLVAAGVPTSLGDVTIGLTRYDMEIQSVPRWRFGFSSRSSSARIAVVSTARMDPRCLGDESDDELLFQRMTKMVGKNIGYLYLGLPLSTDRRSIMYNNILSVADLDRMRDDLPPGR